MKNKKLILAVAALVAIVAVLLGVYFATRPQGTQGAKTITVTVVHQNGSEKSFTCHTDAEFLDTVLLDEKIVEGEMGEFGLFFQTADSETAEGEGWWKICVGEEAASTGASQIPVTDGTTYKLVYTIGW